MLLAAVLHFLAGALTGSVFKIRTLLALLIFVLVEAVVLVVFVSEFAAIWAIGNFLTIQLGYFAGLYARRRVEEAGYSLPPVRIRSPE